MERILVILFILISSSVCQAEQRKPSSLKTRAAKILDSCRNLLSGSASTDSRPSRLEIDTDWPMAARASTLSEFKRLMPIEATPVAHQLVDGLMTDAPDRFSKVVEDMLLLKDHRGDLDLLAQLLSKGVTQIQRRRSIVKETSSGKNVNAVGYWIAHSDESKSYLIIYNAGSKNFMAHYFISRGWADFDHLDTGIYIPGDRKVKVETVPRLVALDLEKMLPYSR